MTLIYHPDYLKHMQHPGHPESPARLEAIMRKLKNENIFNNVLKPEKASIEQLTLIHTMDYVKLIKNFGEGYYDADTYIRSETFDIASLAVGGALQATNFSYENNKTTFALLRPPGHHVGRNYAGGFCYFNNIAIGSQKLVEKYNSRPAIIDIDVHHGNGTCDIFHSRNDVLYISTHLYGIYPGTGPATDIGSGEGKGFTINIPFHMGCGDVSYNLAFEKIIEPIVTQFKPDMILVSIGVDAHYKDLLGSLTLSSQGYISLAKRIIDLSKNLCKNRCTFMLEGGYNVDALSEVVAGIVASFENREVDLKFTDVIDKEGVGREIVDSVVKIQKNYWKL